MILTVNIILYTWLCLFVNVLMFLFICRFCLLPIQCHFCILLYFVSPANADLLPADGGSSARSYPLPLATIMGDNVSSNERPSELWRVSY